PDQRRVRVVGEEPVEHAALAAADVDDDVVGPDGGCVEDDRDVLVVRVAGVEGAEVGEARARRAAERLAVAQVAEEVEERARRRGDGGPRFPDPRRSRERQPERTRSVSPPASRTRRARRPEPRIAVRTALIRLPRKDGPNTTTLRSSRPPLENCCL